MNKKGSVADVFFIVIALLFTAVFIVLVYLVNDSITGAMIPALANSTNNTAITAPLTAVRDIFHTQMDYMYLAAFFGLFIASCVFAFMTPSSPIFFGLSIIIMMGLMIISPVFSNAWEIFTGSSSDITAISTAMPMMNFIMSNLPIIAIVMAIIIAIILFSRGGSGGTVQMQ